MARVTYSSLISNIAGSVGNSVFTNLSGAPVVKSKPITIGGKSSRQLLMMSSMSSNVAAWQQLPANTKTLWSNVAQFQNQIQKNTNSTRLTGYQLFIKANQIRAASGLSIITEPDYSVIPPVSTIPSLIINTPSLSLIYEAVLGYNVLIMADGSKIEYVNSELTIQVRGSVIANNLLFAWDHGLAIIYYTADMVHWESTEVIAGTYSIISVAHANGYYWVLSDVVDTIYYSTDLASWANFESEEFSLNQRPFAVFGDYVYLPTSTTSKIAQFNSPTNLTFIDIPYIAMDVADVFACNNYLFAIHIADQALSYMDNVGEWLTIGLAEFGFYPIKVIAYDNNYLICGLGLHPILFLSSAGMVSVYSQPIESTAINDVMFANDVIYAYDLDFSSLFASVNNSPFSLLSASMPLPYLSNLIFFYPPVAPAPVSPLLTLMLSGDYDPDVINFNIKLSPPQPPTRAFSKSHLVSFQVTQADFPNYDITLLYIATFGVLPTVGQTLFYSIVPFSVATAKILPSINGKLIIT